MTLFRRPSRKPRPGCLGATRALGTRATPETVLLLDVYDPRPIVERYHYFNSAGASRAT
jgi:hypothetical protein